MHKKHRLLLGAHVSIAGGLDKAFEHGVSLGCTTIQIFTKSNRQWHAKKIEQQEIDNYLDAQKRTGITPVVAHASYLINLGSPDKTTRSRSFHALKIELERCSALNIPYLVIHPGAHVSTDEVICLEHITQAIDALITEDPGNTTLLLETMSGQGSTVCYMFEQLAFVINKIKHKKRLGVCLDTCHVFAAGYDLRTSIEYDHLWHAYEKVLGLETLKVIHMNDSKKGCGSRIDRHEHIGEGAIGIHAFKLLMNDERFFDIPKILETPLDATKGHEQNLHVLRGLLTKETKKALSL